MSNTISNSDTICKNNTPIEKIKKALIQSIVKNIIQDHNAKIELDSTDERTQFKITFSR